MGQPGGFPSSASSSANVNSSTYQQQTGMYGNAGTPTNLQAVNQQPYQNAESMGRQQLVQRQAGYSNAGQSNQQVQLERTPATALMGFPGSVRQIQNPVTNQSEYVQTKMIVVELKSNQYGYGINLNDNDGVVRIQGSRSNPDGTPSPSQQNPNIKPNDVIYKVQNVVLGANSPLNLVSLFFQLSQ